MLSAVRHIFLRASPTAALNSPSKSRQGDVPISMNSTLNLKVKARPEWLVLFTVALEVPIFFF